jgi:hypothetical protein
MPTRKYRERIQGAVYMILPATSTSGMHSLGLGNDTEGEPASSILTPLSIPGRRRRLIRK